MKKKEFLVIGIVVFAILVVGASVLYNYLKDKVEREQLYVEEEGETEETEETNQATDFTVTDIDGKEVKLSDFRGKPVVMNFWASWCGPCTLEMPDFEEAYKTYQEEIQFLMVNMTDGSQETVESATKFISDGGYTFPVYYDTKMEAARSYRVYSIPRTYFIDAEGNIVAQSSGMLDAESLQQGIDMIK